MDKLGEALRLIRVFHDVSITELAERIDISPSYISEVENLRKKPSLELISRYAKLFDTTPSSIMFFSEEMGPKDRIRKTIRKKTIRLLQILENHETR